MKKALIIKEIEIIGDKGKTRARTLFNSGASNSIIRRDIAEGIATLIKHPKPLEFVLGDGKSIIRAEYFTLIDFVVKGTTFSVNKVAVSKDLEDDLIIGADGLQRWKIKLDMEGEDLIIDKSVLRFRLV